MRIPELNEYLGRNPGEHFRNQPLEIRTRECDWLHDFMRKGKREGGSVPARDRRVFLDKNFASGNVY